MAWLGTNNQRKKKKKGEKKKREQVNIIYFGGGDVAQLVERRTGTLLRQVRFPGAARDFSPRVNFQCRLSYGVRTLLCATAYINICVHVKDSVAHVRVRWNMVTQTPSVHRRLGSATLLQLAFPG